MPRRIVVVHFNPPNLDKRLARLAGHDVETVLPKGPADLEPLRERPPDAFVVDLERRRSEGRSVAVQLRRYASTRPVPLVFAGGEEDQVARVRNLLPDATYVPSELSEKFEHAKASIAPGGTLWICWPKKASGVESALGQAEVRRHGMDRGLVDFKVAATDQTWSGLRFARKKR